MKKYPDNVEPLPAEKLCNKYNNPNPIKGEGALGNQNKGRMHYEGNDRKKLVETVQMMLNELGCNLGGSGPNKNGVDGIFGDKTEDAVKQFQEKGEDWEDNPLKVDGLVGPRTSDALNREMVGRWYSVYETPKKLTIDFIRVTAAEDDLGEGVSLNPEELKKAKIFLINRSASDDSADDIEVESPLNSQDQEQNGYAR